MDKNYCAIYQSWLKKDREVNKRFTIFAETYRLALKHDGIISQSDIEHVKAGKSNEEMNDKLFLEIMPSKGEKGLKKLMELLDEDGHEQLLGFLRDVQGLGNVQQKLWGNIPSMNRCFVGRQSTIDKIKCQFGKIVMADPSTIVVVVGMGGVGKTQVATEYVCKHKSDYNRVVWISASISKCDPSFVKFAKEFNLSGREISGREISETVENVKRFFEKCSPCLIVFDDAGNYGQIAKYLPKNGCNILVTSRYAYWPKQKAECLKLLCFIKVESALFIQKMLQKDDSPLDANEVSDLGQVLGHLPLALAQACCYIRECTSSISVYVKMFNSRNQVELLAAQNLPVDDANENTIFITWDITREAIENRPETANMRLFAAQCYRTGDIENAKMYELELKSNERFIEPDDRSLRSFLDFDCIRINLKPISEEEIEKCINFQMQRLNDADMLRADAMCETGGLNSLRISSFSICAEAMQVAQSQAREYFESALSTYDIALASNRATIFTGKLFDFARKCSWLPDMYLQKELLKKALAIQEKYFGQDHPGLADTFYYLGWIHGQLFDFEKAQVYFEQTLQINEKFYSADHPKNYQALFDLAQTLMKSGDIEKAIVVLKKILLLSSKIFRPDLESISPVVTNLVMACVVFGDNISIQDTLNSLNNNSAFSVELKNWFSLPNQCAMESPLPSDPKAFLSCATNAVVPICDNHQIQTFKSVEEKEEDKSESSAAMQKIQFIQFMDELGLGEFKKYTQFDITTLLNQLLAENNHLSTDDLKINDQEFKELTDLTMTEGSHSKTVRLTALHKLLKWPDYCLLPALEVFHCFLLNKFVADHFFENQADALDMIIVLCERAVANESATTSGIPLVVCKIIANSVAFSSGKKIILLCAPKLVDVLMSFCVCSPTADVQIAASAALKNICLLVATDQVIRIEKSLLFAKLVFNALNILDEYGFDSFDKECLINWFQSIFLILLWGGEKILSLANSFCVVKRLIALKDILFKNNFDENLRQYLVFLLRYLMSSYSTLIRRTSSVLRRHPSI